MKKLLLVVGILASSVAMAEGNVVETKLGFDLTNRGEVKYEDEKAKIVKKGVNLGVEYRKELSDKLSVGGGIGLEVRKFKKDELETEANTEVKTKNFVAVPVYATARYSFGDFKGVKPFVKSNLGFSLNSGSQKVTSEGETLYEAKVKNGYVYGVGAGVEYKNWTTDLSYNINAAKIELKEDGDKEKVKFKNKALTLSVGYGFKF